MNAMNALAGPPEPGLAEAEFRRIADFLQRRTGIALPDTKRPLVYSRLARRLRQLGLADFAAYLQLIESPDGAAEVSEMISALTTNVTSFFRERHHFDMLRETVLPPLLSAARQGQRLRIWSAGCSSGEEPYSIAMVLLSLLPEAARYDIRILATDIDTAILARARAGLYSAEAAEGLEPRLRERFFRPEPGGIRASPELAQLITFREMNLSSGWPAKGPFQVIFCRNVAIYFDRTVQERVWSGFADRLAPGGVLCIGHSERLIGPAAQMLRTNGITAYRRP